MLTELSPIHCNICGAEFKSESRLLMHVGQCKWEHSGNKPLFHNNNTGKEYDEYVQKLEEQETQVERWKVHVREMGLGFRVPDDSFFYKIWGGASFTTIIWQDVNKLITWHDEAGDFHFSATVSGRTIPKPTLPKELLPLLECPKRLRAWEYEKFPLPHFERLAGKKGEPRHDALPTQTGRERIVAQKWKSPYDPRNRS